MKKIALGELGVVADELLAALPRGLARATIVGLSGNLGAGKTTFVQTLGRKLGISETIQSPTYVLMKTYAINYPPFIQLVHIDAYRLMNPEEFLTLKPERFLNDPKNLVIVEWPEQVVGLLPAPDITMQFSADGAEEGERYIEITSHA